MRVILLVTDHQRGGSPLRLARLARGLRAAGVEVHAGCLAPRGPVSDELGAAGIPTFSCDAADARDLPALTRLARHVRRIKPDLIHATLTHANVAARMVGIMQRIPVIGSTATIEVERRWHAVVERATARLDQAHLVNSRAVAEHVVTTFGVAPRRVRVIPPSLDPFPQRVDRKAGRAGLGLATDESIVAWAGRFDVVKRLEIVVACAELLATPPVRFLLVGDGPDRASLEQLLARSTAAARVQLLGWRDDVPAVLSAADAFVFPSRTEGLPSAVLEAMAVGLPIVASDIPAHRELAGDGERLRLAAGDDPRPYAEALREILADPAGGQALGARASAWAAAELDPAATTRAVLAVYAGVLKRRRL